MQRVFGLDVARAAAILLVLASHTGVWMLEEWALSEPLRRALESFTFLSGFLGVELFFVLSGLLVGGIALREFEDGMDGATLKRFYLRRWLRTLPAYYVMLALLAVVLYEPVSWRHIFFLQAFTPQRPDVFSVSWSLCVEEWFYLLLPLYCFVLMRLPERQRLWFIGASILLIGVLRALVWAEFTPAFETMRRFVPIRLDALLTGVWLAALMRYRPEWFGRLQWIGWIVLPLAAGAFALHAWRHAHPETLTFLKNHAFMPWWFTVVSFSFALLLAWLCAWKQAAGMLAALVGRLSMLAYALYLTHNEIFRLLRADDALAQSVFGPVLGLVLAFGASFVLFRGVEYPFMKWRDRITYGKARA